MKYEHMMTATFLERPNRFIAYADLNGRRVKCHVKNTGRCKELLLPGTEILLQHHPDAALTGRSTEYSLISVYKETSRGKILINMDSQAPNQAAYEWLVSQGLSPRREVTYGASRIDLAFEANGQFSLMEVKGVTLEENGMARFPDAPTERGIKHLKELSQAASQGISSYALFVIAMKGVRGFEANRITHPEFADALSQAASSGVRILAFDCIITPDSMKIDKSVPVLL